MSVTAVARQVSLSAYYVLIILAILSPLPFGSARDWAWPFLTAVTAACAVFWFAAHTVRNRAISHPPLSRLYLASALYLLAIGWAYLQTVTWLPTGWQHPLWQMQAGTTGGTVSIDPDLTTAGVLRFLGYFLIFVLTAASTANSQRARQTLLILAVVGGLYALYGLLIFAGGNHSVAWIEKWAYPNDLTATFINRNSFATYAGLSLLLSLSGLFDILRQQTWGRGGWQRRIEQGLTVCLQAKPLMLLVLSVAITVALLLSNSRAGIAATFAALLVMLFFSLRQARLPQWLRWGCVILFIALASGLIANSTSQVGLRVLQTNLDTEERLPVYHLTLQAIADAPYTGYGLGTFDPAFAMYRDHTVTGYFDRAHSDYLELMMDLGIPAALSLWTAIAVLFAYIMQGVRERQRLKQFPILAVSATVLVGLHGLVDFSMQMPAVAVLYVVILGLGYGQSVRTTRAVV